MTWSSLMMDGTVVKAIAVPGEVPSVFMEIRDRVLVAMSPSDVRSLVADLPRALDAAEGR